MPLFDTIRRDVDELVAQYAALAGDGTVTFKEACALGIEALHRFMQLVEEFAEPGPEKKAAVLRAAGEFYDIVIGPLDAPGPDVILDPLARRAWLAAMEWTIDGLVRVLFK